MTEPLTPAERMAGRYLSIIQAQEQRGDEAALRLVKMYSADPVTKDNG